MKKRTRIILAAFLLLMTIGWGVNKWIIGPRIKKEQKELRESALKQHLRDMRKAIDQFANDQRHLPQSLDDLVKQAYVREIPTDPITNRNDWAVEFGEATADFGGGNGIVDVSSNAPGVASDGALYSDY